MRFLVGSVAEERWAHNTGGSVSSSRKRRLEGGYGKGAGLDVCIAQGGMEVAYLRALSDLTTLWEDAVRFSLCGDFELLICYVRSVAWG